MNIPIESPDIRRVYLQEMYGQRSDRQIKLDPRIARIRQKILNSLKARAALLHEASTTNKENTLWHSRL